MRISEIFHSIQGEGLFTAFHLCSFARQAVIYAAVGVIRLTPLGPRKGMTSALPKSCRRYTAMIAAMSSSLAENRWYR